MSKDIWEVFIYVYRGHERGTASTGVIRQKTVVSEFEIVKFKAI